MRKQSVFKSLGKIWFSTLRSEISYNQQHHETRFGVLGIRVWLSKGLLKNAINP
jgi:ribosomal protein S3